MSSIRILLESAIDFAGLFPPAGLGMRAAVDEYAACRHGEASWALGRFVVPALRLDEFEDAFRRTPAAGRAEMPWRLSALCGPDRDSDLERVCEFNRRRPRQTDYASAIVDTIELRVRSPEEIHPCAAVPADRYAVYFEVPLHEDTPSLIAAVAASGRHAKVRTGGPVAELFPTAAELALFIDHCSKTNVSFKATAGLHHPFRSLRPLGSDPAGPSAVMHGFLNLFIAAAIARTGASVGVLAEVLSEETVSAFKFGPDGASWHSQRLTGDQLREAHRQSVHSFGSCSFREPIDDLKTLHLL